MRKTMTMPPTAKPGDANETNLCQTNAIDNNTLRCRGHISAG